MPGRVDDAIRIACVKRFPGTRAGLGTIGLSLIIVGMLDNAALAPLASVAMTDARSWTVRAGFLHRDGRRRARGGRRLDAAEVRGHAPRDEVPPRPLALGAHAVPQGVARRAAC